MKCDRLAKCCAKAKKNQDPEASSITDTYGPRRPETWRDIKVHQRLVRQAPNFLPIPSVRIDFRFWKKPEEIVKERLDAHDYYPFGVVSPFGIYRLRYTQDSFWYGLFAACLLIACFIFLLYWTREYEKEDDKEDFLVDMWLEGQFFVAFFSGVFVFLIVWWSWAKTHIHTLFIDCQTLTYEVFRGGRLKYRGHFHNIYVKLKCVQTQKARKTKNKDDRRLYYLILSGYDVSPIFLSPKAKSYYELRKLGKRIATNFNINFIDVEHVSKHHQIRHRCAYGVDDQLDDGLDSFFDNAEEWTEDKAETRNSLFTSSTERRRTLRDLSGQRSKSKSVLLLRSGSRGISKQNLLDVAASSRERISSAVTASNVVRPSNVR